MYCTQIYYKNTLKEKLSRRVKEIQLGIVISTSYSLALDTTVLVVDMFHYVDLSILDKSKVFNIPYLVWDLPVPPPISLHTQLAYCALVL